jgi:CheY-like chemotaxis protein
VNGRALRICLIDDDPIALRVVAAVLRGLGHEVTTRDQALGSLTAVTLGRPDVVLLDLAMPGLSGIGLGDLIREASAKSGRRIAIVVCSGEPKAVVDAAAARIGAHGAVSKSTNVDALRDAFAAVLASLSTRATA